jgi:hypothetical protein
MKAITSAIIICLTAYNVSAQTDIWNSPQAYLAQTPPGNTPVKFAPELINDSPFFSMDRCAFSRDGREFYYSRNNTWFSDSAASLQVCKFDGTKWNASSTFLHKYYGVTFSLGGDTMYFIGGRKAGVSEVHCVAGGWSEPAIFLKRSYGMYDFMSTRSGNMYAASNINGNVNDYSCYDVCKMLPLSTKDTSITTLEKPLNTPGFDGDFFVSPDESYIIISAKEQQDFECELYISYHKEDGSWTNPKSLGPEINNGPAHRWGEYVTPDNKYLFYSYGHSPADCAIYWVRFDNLLEKFRHSNFQPYVKDSIGTQTATLNKDFKLQISDNTFYDDDGSNTLHYSANLADGMPLPAWLTFHEKKKMLSGKPGQKQLLQIQITATDNEKETAICTFLLKVE